jgi:phosphoglucomutase
MNKTLSLEDTLTNLREAVRNEKISEATCQHATHWLSEPPYQQYRTDIAALVADQNWEELSRLFWQVIPFGTGGRRGVMSEFGSATINERTIAESAYGLAAYLLHDKEGQKLSAVIAYDTRNRSREFARLTACVLAAQGLKVHFFTDHRSTPELSFAVRDLECHVGVMITASHNPPSDNGFKAYWKSGGQVLEPHDQGIIDCVYQAGEIEVLDYDQAVAQKKIVEIGPEVDRRYLDAVRKLSLSENRDIKALFSPLHGVGETSVYRLLQEAGFEGVTIFGPHREPNGDFPNVPNHFPNPEQLEVFDPMLETARREDASVIFATDPDADRVGVLARDGNGEYAPISGNHVGALLADYALRKRIEQVQTVEKSVIIKTIVTTDLIAKIARAAGARVVDDLPVGFKYIGEAIDKARAEGYRFLFGSEESLGYLAGEYARDKDAAIASLWLLELAAELQAQGKTLHDRLSELFVQHGYHYETQFSKVCQGESGRQKIEKILRAFSERPPEEIANLSLNQVRDYQKQVARILPANRFHHKLDVPKAELLLFESPPGPFRYQFAVRPSGTEPKMKFYLFAQMDCPDLAILGDVKEQTAMLVERVIDSLNEWITAVENE